MPQARGTVNNIIIAFVRSVKLESNGDDGADNNEFVFDSDNKNGDGCVFGLLLLSSLFSILLSLLSYWGDCNRNEINCSFCCCCGCGCKRKDRAVGGDVTKDVVVLIK